MTKRETNYFDLPMMCRQTWWMIIKIKHCILPSSTTTTLIYLWCVLCRQTWWMIIKIKHCILPTTTTTTLAYLWREVRPVGWLLKSSTVYMSYYNYYSFGLPMIYRQTWWAWWMVIKIKHCMNGLPQLLLQWPTYDMLADLGCKLMLTS